MRQDAVKHSRNLWRKRRIKDQLKSFDAAVHSHDVSAAQEQYRKACALLDKVATTSTIHKNTAARRKSRMSRTLRDMKKKAGTRS
jgi:small subunit ribosomal protein S20